MSEEIYLSRDCQGGPTVPVRVHSINIVYEDISKLGKGRAGFMDAFEVCKSDRFPVSGV